MSSRAVELDNRLFCISAFPAGVTRLGNPYFALCHGALAKHADDPSTLKPQKPDPAVLCVRCHEADAAKPHSFPQVSSKEHSQGNSCGVCHDPHSPKL